MKIKNIQITNFRNLQNVNIKMQDINILTGRNGSGKTNFLNALAHVADCKKYLADYFNNNITTFGKGKNTTKFSVTVENPVKISFNSSSNGNSERKLYFINELEFSNQIRGIDGASRGAKLKLYGSILNDKSWNNIDYGDYIKSKKFVKELNISDEVQVAQTNPEKLVNEPNSNERHFIGKDGEGDRYGDDFEKRSKNFVTYRFVKAENNKVYVNLNSSEAIQEFVQEIPSQQMYEVILARLKNGNREAAKRGSFGSAIFSLLVADIQSNKKQKSEYYKDLSLYTDNLIKKVFIKSGMRGDDKSIGNIGGVYVDTPNAPSAIATVSAGSAILIFFITLKNWLQLNYAECSYDKPSIILFDEIDSCIHPSLLPEFVELLRIIANRLQIIVTSHSATFIDFFEKKEIFYIKPCERIGKIYKNRSDIFSYEDIINKLDENEKADIGKLLNSELFIDGAIEKIYPVED